MEFLVIAVVVLAIVAVIYLWPRNQKSADGIVTESLPSPKTLEEKLDALASCGIRLRPGISVNDLLGSWERAEYEEPGFDLTLVGVGMTQEKPPWTPRSENLWHFDTECIEDHGSYVDIAKRMMDLAGGSLPLSNLEDHVDLEEGEAWLSFTLDSQTIRIDCAVDDDWVDSKVFGHFVRLLAKKDPSKIFFHHDLDGQDCIIGCIDSEGFTRLRQLIPKVQPLA